MPCNRHLVQFRPAALVLLALLTGAVHSVSAARRSFRNATQDAPANTVTDEVGRQISIPARVNRIVTLSPDLTETIYALGLEDKLAGDTSYCDTPPAAKRKPHVGEPLNPSLEAIVAMRPDLVLASTSINRRETVDALARLGIAVYASNPHTVRGMLDSVKRISALAGAGASGETLVAQLQAKLDALQARLADALLIHVLFVTWQDPLISIGQNTFIADALRWAGAESVILSDQNWPRISFEEVVRLQPDYIVFTSNHGGGAPSQLAELRTRPGWSGLRAVELGSIAVASDEMARPSPGMIDAIEKLARVLHPDAFSHSNMDWELPAEAHAEFFRAVAATKDCSSCVP